MKRLRPSSCSRRPQPVRLRPGQPAGGRGQAGRAGQPGTGRRRSRRASPARPKPARATRSASVNPRCSDRPASTPRRSPGFREVIVGGQVVYVSDDGKYLMQGTLFDLARARRTSATPAMARVRRELLDDDPGQRPHRVLAGRTRSTRVTVFTDVDCGYCRKLHSADRRLQQAGHHGRIPVLPARRPGQRGLQQDGVGLVRGRPPARR